SPRSQARTYSSAISRAVVAVMTGVSSLGFPMNESLSGIYDILCLIRAKEFWSHEIRPPALDPPAAPGPRAAARRRTVAAAGGLGAHDHARRRGPVLGGRAGLHRAWPAGRHRAPA